MSFGRAIGPCGSRSHIFSLIKTQITINVPVVFMARDVMILMRATTNYKDHWKGWALTIENLLGPEMATSGQLRNHQRYVESA
jgi:hypothetical protein